jgi:hypothetical protein
MAQPHLCSGSYSLDSLANKLEPCANLQGTVGLVAEYSGKGRHRLAGLEHLSYTSQADHSSEINLHFDDCEAGNWRQMAR